MKTKKLLALVLALVMILALTTACGSEPAKAPDPSAPQTQEPAASAEEPTQEPAAPAEEPTQEPAAPKETIKIGHIVDLTGSEAMTGEEAKKSLEFALESFGGEIDGHPVEIIVGDAQGASDTAVDVARRMVEQGVVAVFGPTQAGQKNGVAEYLKEAEIPVILYNGTPAYVFAANEWVVGAGGANPQMNVMADFAYNELGYRKVNVVTMDNIGFRTFTDDFATVFKKLGGEILAEHYGAFPTSDWSPILASLPEADAIISWTTGTNATALWRDWYTTGMYEKQPITAVLSGAFTEYYIMEALDSTDPAITEAALGTYSPAAYVYDIDTPENKAFIEEWVAKFGTVPASNLPGQVYQALQLMKTAVENMDKDEFTSRELLEALKSCDITGPAGRLFFDGTGAATKDIYIVKSVRLEDGTYNQETVKVYKDVAPTGFEVK